jgi:fermentation-respiration switch protein FrsA (DUF1100 family)
MPAVIAVVILLALAYTATSVWVGTRVLKVRRLPLTATPSISHTAVSFSSRVDHVQLRGWYFASGPECVIMVSGGEQNRADEETGTIELAADLVASGHSVLLFDMRGRGESSGQGSFLHRNERDIGGAVDLVRGRGHRKVFIMGFSAGAAAAILFVSRETVTGLISDSCFASLRETFTREAEKRDRFPVLAHVLAPGVYVVARAFSRFWLEEPLAAVRRVTSPIMFIHGADDDGVPVQDTHRLYRAVGKPAQAPWVVPGAGHTRSYRTDPPEYVRRLTAFLRESVAQAGPG